MRCGYLLLCRSSSSEPSSSELYLLSRRDDGGVNFPSPELGGEDMIADSGPWMLVFSDDWCWYYYDYYLVVEGNGRWIYVGGREACCGVGGVAMCGLVWG